jgi:hypothetical protein
MKKCSKGIKRKRIEIGRKIRGILRKKKKERKAFESKGKDKVREKEKKIRKKEWGRGWRRDKIMNA